MTASTSPRKSDISRALGRILGKDKRNAGNGWDTVVSGSDLLITLNYFTEADDRAAYDKISDTLGSRYRLDYIPVLADYDELPEDYEHCAVIEVRTLPATPAETAQEIPVSETPEPAETPAPVAATVKWTDTLRGHHHAELTFPTHGTPAAPYRLSHAPHGTRYTHLAYSHDRSARVARTNSLTDLVAECAAHAGITAPLAIQETGRRYPTR